jgi:hypothetical protein
MVDHADWNLRRTPRRGRVVEFRKPIICLKPTFEKGDIGWKLDPIRVQMKVRTQFWES